MISKLIPELQKLSFFAEGTGRTIENTEENIIENEHLYHFLFTDINSTDVINSIMVLRGAYRTDGSTLPGYVTVTNTDTIVKYDIDAKKIVITLSSEGDKPGASVEFDDFVGEDAFFQESLITDMRSLTYDYVDVVLKVAKIVEEYDKK